MIMSKKEIVLTYYMKDILESHPVVNLKKILKKMKQDIGAYSKMNKADLVNKIIELKNKGYPVPKVEMYVKPPRKKTAPVQAEKKTEEVEDLLKKATARMIKEDIGRAKIELRQEEKRPVKRVEIINKYKDFIASREKELKKRLKAGEKIGNLPPRHHKQLLGVRATGTSDGKITLSGSTKKFNTEQEAKDYIKKNDYEDPTPQTKAFDMNTYLTTRIPFRPRPIAVITGTKRRG